MLRDPSPPSADQDQNLRSKFWGWVMGKYLGIIIGAIIVLLGIIGITRWWCDFLTVLRGSIPAMLILGGAIAVIAGLSEIKDEVSSKKSRQTSS